jgi:hypothetical protein
MEIIQCNKQMDAKGRFLHCSRWRLGNCQGKPLRGYKTRGSLGAAPWGFFRQQWRFLFVLVYTFGMKPLSAQLYSDFQIKIARDETWRLPDLELFYESISLFAKVMGRSRLFGEILVEKADTHGKLALAYKDRIQLSMTGQLSAWSVIHELAHVWDAKNDWEMSLALEEFTGGFTDRALSERKKGIPAEWDAGQSGAEKKPGLYGRKPGVNAYGYFYGDKPSGANWRFNRKEDFAESVAMYCGWRRDNPLSKTAHGRIERYLLPNGTKDPIYRIADNWSDYARYFYPEGGDYAKTKRWEFVKGLVK